MENKKDIVELFSSQEMKNKVEDIIRVIDELSQKTPVIGLHYRFYVPGWIGAIQQSVVEGKMAKVGKQPFCNNMNYFEFGDWIIQISNELVKLYSENKGNDEEQNKEQAEAIIRLCTVLAALWTNCYPEISTYCNIKYDENTLISAAGLVYEGLKENLKSLGYEENEEPKRNTGMNLGGEFKSMLYRLVGMFLNILILAAIFGVIEAIFGD